MAANFRYAICPKWSKKKRECLQDLSAYLIDKRCGTPWQSIDKRGGTPWKSTTARDKLLTMTNEFALADISSSLLHSRFLGCHATLPQRGSVVWHPTKRLRRRHIFRERNQHKISFTYKSKALKLSSRIELFLIARHLTKWVERVEAKVSNGPDNRAVRLTLSIAQVSRGPGLWKFNNSLLEDEKYADLIKRKLYCHQWKVHRLRGQKSRVGDELKWN